MYRLRQRVISRRLRPSAARTLRIESHACRPLLQLWVGNQLLRTVARKNPDPIRKRHAAGFVWVTSTSQRDPA